jgi:hypothetical protein
MQHPVTIISLSEEEFLGRTIDSTVGDIRCGFIDQLAPFACHLTGSHAKFRQPALQPCLKFSDLPFVQSGVVCIGGIVLPALSLFHLECHLRTRRPYSVKSGHNFWPLHQKRGRANAANWSRVCIVVLPLPALALSRICTCLVCRCAVLAADLRLYTRAGQTSTISSYLPETDLSWVPWERKTLGCSQSTQRHWGLIHKLEYDELLLSHRAH